MGFLEADAEMEFGLQDVYNGSTCVEGVELGRGRSRSAAPIGSSRAYTACQRGPIVGWNAGAFMSPHCQLCVGCPESKGLPPDEAALRSQSCPEGAGSWKQLILPQSSVWACVSCPITFSICIMGMVTVPTA